jgi:hypothetical protein
VWQALRCGGTVTEIESPEMVDYLLCDRMTDEAGRTIATGAAMPSVPCGGRET